MLHLGDEAQVVAHFSPFGDSVILTQDRCTVCTERTIGLEIVLDATNGTHRGRGSYGISFWSIWRMLVSVHDSCTVGARRTIGSEILLDAPDGTPRWRSSSGRKFRSWRKIGALFALNVQKAHKSFWMHPMLLLGDKAQVVARFSPFRDSVILTQHRCTVCN